MGFIIIQVGDLKIGTEEKNIINQVLDSGRIYEGEKVKEFESKWASYVGTNYSVAMSSGTSALISALSALPHLEDLNVKKGSKVITTPLTYISTVNSVTLSNLEPIFVDISSDTFGITPDNIKKHLENVDDIEEYSLILPVHLMGFPCDMRKINKIAKDFGLNVIEDSAQAHGSVYNGKKTGSMSLMSIFSFYIAHNIQVGEMGAVNTNNRELAELCRKMKSNGRTCSCLICNRNQGKCPIKLKHVDEDIDPRFTHDIIGYNFKTMEFQAALGICQLDKVEWITKKRNDNVKYLNEGLEDFSHLLKLPNHSEDISYLAYPIVIKRPDIISRKKLRSELETHGIETRPLFGCIPTQQPAYDHLKQKYFGKLPNADYIGLNAFYIGCHQYLNQVELDYIINAFKIILERK